MDALNSVDTCRTRSLETLCMCCIFEENKICMLNLKAKIQVLESISSTYRQRPTKHIDMPLFSKVLIRVVRRQSGTRLDAPAR